MEPVRLILEPRQVEAGQLTVAARLEHPDGRRQRLWWGVPEAWSDAVTAWADPYVVAFVFSMMQWGRDVVVEGRASPSLLANLETYMAIWHTWMPQTYRPVHIRADDEVESPPPPQPGQTVVPFSGGLDACFTALRHRRGLIGRRSRPLAAGVVMHGFDISLDQDNSAGIYRGLLADARRMLDSIQLACIPMTTNYRHLPLIRHDSHGVHLVSGLRLLAGRFDAALVPNSTPYTLLSRPWGSHPVCEPLLSSRHFQVIDDGAEMGRVAKAELVAEWPEAMRHLRVCGYSTRDHTNCGRCEKCIRTALAFRAAGGPTPTSFTDELTYRQIRSVRIATVNPNQMRFWREIVFEADRRGLGRTEWAKAVRAMMRRNRLRWLANRLRRPFLPLRNAIRTVFRGSPLSRRELAEQSAARRDRHSL